MGNGYGVVVNGTQDVSYGRVSYDGAVTDGVPRTILLVPVKYI